MKNNKNIIIICAIIALSILSIDIILTLIAKQYSFSIIMIILFIIATLLLIKFTNKKEKNNPLTNIEYTIKLKLEDLNSESIHPVKSDKPVEILNDESIKKDLEYQRQNNITKETIEEELGKTIFISNLQNKIKLFEEQQELIKKQAEEQELKELNKLIKNKTK
jgi:energy-coupling factor transporter transmembrane protein EcfT